MNKTCLILAAVALVALGAAVLFATNTSPAKQGSESSLDRIIREGVIRACWGHYPPVTSKDPKTGKVVGHMAEAFEWVAEEAGLKVEWKETSWGTFAAALQSGECDVMISALFAKIPRAKAIAFTTPILYVTDSVLVRKEDAAKYGEFEDFNKKGIRVAVIQGESGMLIAQKRLPNAELITLQGSDISLALSMVSAGRADAAVTDGWSIAQYAKVHDDVVDLFKDKPLSINPAGWGVRKEDQELLNFLNTAIEFAEANGVFKKTERAYNATWLHLKREYSED